ncbi:MAG: sensor family protein [Candidatus Krumholzibacteriota bacterium]|jgi:uncharacterized membrane protein|nr:sensor family protein [Candidatus Krumholzibacteriota bacterium]
MSKRIDEYLNELKKGLSGADAAVVQDALSDAEEYLRNGVEQCRSEAPGLAEDAALDRVIGEYGSAAEVAAAYREIERRTPPAMAPVAAKKKHSAARRFFGVFVDPRAYASLFYMLFALVTGIFYFTWVTTGLSLSAGLIILVIGLPFFALFLLSVRGIALVEGRLVEALLGVRMPRRPKFAEKMSFWLRLKTLFTDRRSWFAMIYMVALLPLGCLYFTLFVTMLSLGLAGIAMPILQWGFGFPLVQWSGGEFYAPDWVAPLFVVVGVLWFLVTLHLAKGLGQLHGRFAKTMLVRE